MKTGYELAQQFDPFGSSVGRQQGEACSVCARSRQTCDETGADRIPHQREDYRDDRRRLLCRYNLWGSVGDDYIDLEPDELGGELGDTLSAAFRPAVSDCDGAALDPAELAQPLEKRGDPLSLGRRRGRA